MKLFQELKRRNVFRVGVAYAVATWVLLQVFDVVGEILALPAWSGRLILAILVVGFFIALILAWAFELTPEGVKRESEVDRSQSITHKTGRKLDFAIIAVLAIVIFLLLGKGWFGGDSISPDTASTPDKSIAVLPFDNRSADAEDAEFIAAGVHDELLTLLSKLGDLRVISRTSVERLDRNLSIPEIGALLGVATVLEGQVQRAGNHLRINIQLVDATQEDHLWANTYNRELTAKNIFDVQSDIARMIADALHAQLSPSDEVLLSNVPTESTEALSRYLLGRLMRNRMSFESLRQADQHLNEAVELDPEYAQAWIAIADNRSQMLQTGMIDMQEYLVVAEPAIAQALELDERLPEAHAQLAVLRWHAGDLDAAEESFRMALELNPGDSRSLQFYGEYLRSTGRPQEAIPVLERVLEDDPLSVEILFELGKSEMYVGHPEKNVQYSKRILEIDPSSVSGYVGHLQAYMWQGRYDLMWPWFIKTIATDPEDFELWANLGLDSMELGASDLADVYLGRALVLGPEEPAVLGCQARILAINGKNDEALEIARRALQADLNDRWGSSQVFLRLIRDDALRADAFDDARTWYRNRHPELFANLPEISVDNVNVAADLALLLQRAGQVEQADALIDAGLAWYRETQVPGVYGYLTSIVYIEFLALKAEKRAALDALREAVDGGWNNGWKWHTSSENLASLRNEPEYLAIITQLEGDMATQLNVIRTLPYMGEFDLRSAQGD